MTFSPQQRGGVPGRKIDQNLALVREETQFLHERDTEGAIITVDLARVYDQLTKTYCGN